MVNIMSMLVNIGCGDVYVEGWKNYDYMPHSSHVSQADLLGRLPLSDAQADVVYSSHFIEHIPCELVSGFISECFRITKSGGVLRLVLPDWEELCDTYLSLRRSGGEQHEKADFLMLEMLDQCVRRVSGGELAAYYARLNSEPSEQREMIEFVRQRTGYDLHAPVRTLPGNRWSRLIKNPKKIINKLEQFYIKGIVSLLPSTFRQQNVSLTGVGEKHAWMYDFHTIECLLLQAGFKDVRRMSATTSAISDFPFEPLDVNANGLPRKGAESMYLEAIKP